MQPAGCEIAGSGGDCGKPGMLPVVIPKSFAKQAKVSPDLMQPKGDQLANLTLKICHRSSKQMDSRSSV